jgi:hypothetical protein
MAAPGGQPLPSPVFLITTPPSFSLVGLRCPPILTQCQCGESQPGLNYCMGGFYRWAINVFTFLRNVTVHYGTRTPSFDEPAISMGWPMRIAPHRVGMVGESLFVHCQVCACTVCVCEGVCVSVCVCVCVCVHVRVHVCA